MEHDLPWLLSESNSDVQIQPSGTAQLLTGQDDPGPQRRALNPNSLTSPRPYGRLLPTWYGGSTDFQKELLY